MQDTKIAVIQTAWPGSRQAMVENIQTLVSEAASNGGKIICLQEFTLSPYFASVKDDSNYAWAEPLHGGETDRVLGTLSKQHNVYILGSIFERAEDGVHWDTATVHGPRGVLIGHTRKVHIPQGAGYYEDYYYGGSDQYPIHTVSGVNVAVPTCYDQWFPEMSRQCALNGAEFIFYPTAIGSEPEAPDLDTSESWQVVMRGQAIANGLYIAAANRVGKEGVEFYGRSFICDPMGNVLAEASRDKTEIIYATLDADVMARWRYLFPLLKQRRPDAYGGLTQQHA